MEPEFRREPGNIAISNQGFEVSVSGATDIKVVYKEPGKEASIPAERSSTGGIGLFMDWAQFPNGTTAEEQRRMFERVIRALWFLEIPISWTEIDESQSRWPLPLRPAK